MISVASRNGERRTTQLLAHRAIPGWRCRRSARTVLTRSVGTYICALRLT
jgi:hypothetical protein